MKRSVTTILVVFGLVHIAFSTLWLTAAILYYVTNVYGPKLEFKKNEDQDYMLDDCKVSTNSISDLIVDESKSKEEAGQVLLKHGAAIVQSVLSNETAEALRAYVQRANHQLHQVFVHNNENRFRIMPPAEEPTLQMAMKELGSNKVIRSLLDMAMGPRASLVSLSVITNTYGAEEQHFHRDTVTSARNYPESFVPEYTITIPLQDTTTEMGATGMCPGTHLCEWLDYDEEQNVEDWGVRFNSEEEYREWEEYHLPCDITASVQKGDAMIYNTDMLHRGGAHTDPDAPDRVVLFVTMAASLQNRTDSRTLPLEKVHSLSWNMWGHSVDDFVDMKERPWRWWHSIGLFTKRDTVRAWNMLDACLMIFREEGEVCYLVSNEFDAEFARAMTNIFKDAAIFATGLYACVLTPLLMYAIFRLFERGSKDVDTMAIGNGTKPKVE